MSLHPKYARYFWKAFSFGVIWAIFALVYVFLEKGILGDTTIYPATDNIYDFQNALIFTPIGSFLMGFIQGLIEVLWVQKIFLNRPFWQKIIFKGSFYLFMIIVFLILISLTVNSIRYKASPLDTEVRNSIIAFISNFSFWSIVIYIGVMVDVALFFSEVREYLGSKVIFNYSFGTYYRPKKEDRIFMFLDMKSSTTIAEQMGHEKYFKLIKTYYNDMTDAILETSGEIYQYVGDEIVVTWTQEEGLRRNNCVACFIKISEAIHNNSEAYKRTFGFIPEFKAGIHLGEVTAGEIGTLKKEIIYTGDVLNTSARIQASCNNYGAKLLISEILKDSLSDLNGLKISEIGTITLRGKAAPMRLYKVEF